jgi:hypothetical protein
MPKISRRQFLKLGLTGSIFVMSCPLLIERYLIQVNTYKIPVPNLPEAFEGFRLLQISDIHYGFLLPALLVESVVETANRINAEAIICTGDYVHERNADTPTVGRSRSLFWAPPFYRLLIKTTSAGFTKQEMAICLSHVELVGQLRLFASTVHLKLPFLNWFKIFKLRPKYYSKIPNKIWALIYFLSFLKTRKITIFVE